MTKEEAADILDNIEIEYMFQEQIQALDMAIDTLRDRASSLQNIKG